MVFFFLDLFFQRQKKTQKVKKKLKKTGGFKKESDAARAYDVAALACRGPARALTNFPPGEYLEEIAALAEAAGIPLSSSSAGSVGGPPSSSAAAAASALAALLPAPSRPPPPPPLSLDTLPLLPHDLVVAHVRRRSTAFARGRSPFRGVSGEEGRWEARIGALFGRKNVRKFSILSFSFLFFRLFSQPRPLSLSLSLSLEIKYRKNENDQVSLGVYGSEDDAAKAYDRALIMEKGEKRRKEKRSGEREKRNRKVAENRRRRKGKN